MFSDAGACSPLALMIFLLPGCHGAVVIPQDSGSTDDTSVDSAGIHDSSAQVDISAFYDPDHVLGIEIEMDSDDWDSLRAQKRNVVELLAGDCMSEPLESPYTYFPATVTVDGETVEEVGVRKKGLIGSESSSKPALKIKFDEYVPDLTLSGLERLTLNNAQQDPSYVHQCLGYQVFGAAGLPASRCNFATVRVNGQDLGLYVNVEPIKKDFLRLFFDDDEGNLYEGTLSDFREGWVDTFQRKTNESDPDRSDLDAVVAALEVDDQDLVATLEQVVDLDSFFTYWATEVLVGHWDGYAGNTNNFYIYNDPTSGLFYFIPWGIDAILEGDQPFGSNSPVSVVARSALPFRLYQYGETQTRYVAALQELLDNVWDEASLESEIMRMEDLLTPYLEASETASFSDGLEAVRSFVSNRRQFIQEELAAGPPAWEEELGDLPCLEETGLVSATFSTKWGTLESSDYTDYEANMTLVLDDWEVPLGPFAALAGASDDEYGVIAILGWYDSTTILAPYLVVPLDKLQAGASLAIDWWDVEAYLYYYSEAEGVDWTVAGYLYDGTLELDQAGTEEDDVISGTLEVKIWGALE